MATRDKIICTAFLAGQTQAAIAASLGITLKAVCYALKKNGHVCSPEERKRRIAAGARRSWADPEQRQRRRDSLRRDTRTAARWSELLIDDQDRWLTDAYKIAFAAGDRYPAVRAVCRETGKHLLLARLIMGAQEGECVDHINGNPLDNRRENLRLCSVQQNSWNSRKTRGSSQFKGVMAKGSRWNAQITVDGRAKHLGVFDTPDLAARAYDTAARDLFGPYAALNFPERCERGALATPLNTPRPVSAPFHNAGVTDL